MRRTERVVFTFCAFCEARKAAALANGTNPVPPASQDLMGISLVTYVPQDAVARSIEKVVQCDRELDDPEASSEMAAGGSHGVDCLSPEFLGHLGKLVFVQPAQVGGALYGVQKWS